MNEIEIINPATGEPVIIVLPEGFALPEDPQQQARILRGLLDLQNETVPATTPEPAPPAATEYAPFEFAHPQTGEAIVIDAPVGFTLPTDPERLAQFYEYAAPYIDAPAPTVDPNFDPSQFTGRDTQFGDVLNAWLDAYPDFDVSRVPAGQGMNLGSGFVWFPNENTWYQTNEEGGVDPGVSHAAGRTRVNNVTDPNAVYDFAASPEAIGYMDGMAFGTVPTVLDTFDPVAAEVFRQTRRQNHEDSPWRSMGGELLGGVGGAVTAAGAAPIRSGAAWLSSQPMWAQMGAGALIGGAASSAYEAGVAEPGDRMNRATDPLAVGLGAGLGAAAPAIVPLVGRGYNAARNWLRGAPDDVPLGLPAPSPSELRGGSPYGPPTRGEMDAQQFTAPRTAGAAPGEMVYGTPARQTDFTPSAGQFDQTAAAAQINDYLNSIAPPNEIATQAAVARAGQALDVPVPRGLVTNPERINENLSRPSLWAGGATGQALDRLGRGLSDRFGGIVTDLSRDVRQGLGAAGDRIRTAVNTRLDARINELSGEYDAFNAQFTGRYELPEILNDEMEGIFARRFEAGADEADSRMLGDVERLIARNTVGENEAADAVEGVTWEGLRDARSLLTTRINNMRRTGRQLTPYERDMESMKDSLTDAMTDIVRKNAPEGEGEAAVERFLDLDRQYAIAQQTRRDMGDIMGDTSVTVMDEIRTAIGQGGKTAIDTLNKIKTNAGTTDWNNAMAVMLHNLGARPDGSFDPTKFASDWRKMAPDVLDTVLDKGHKADLDAIAVIGNRLGKITMDNADKRFATDAGKVVMAAALPMPVDVALALGHIERMFTARSLSRPYNARQAAKLYRLADQVGKSASDAERVLRSQQLMSKVKTAARVVGYGGLGLMGSFFTGGNRGPSNETRVVGTIRP